MKISYYIPKGKQTYKKFIDKEIALSRNIKDAKNRSTVFGGLVRIRASAEDGKAFFWDGDELHIVDYHGVSGRYFCGREFDMSLLKIGKKTRYLLVIMDANECIIGELRGKRIIKLWKETSNVPRKHNQGGQSAARFQRARGEVLKRWMKKIGQRVMSYA